MQGTGGSGALKVAWTVYKRRTGAAGDPREVPDPRASISEQSPIMLEKQLPSGCISVSKTVSLCSKATVSSGSGNTGHFCPWCADTVPAYK